MKTLFMQLLAAAVAFSMIGCTTIQPLTANGSQLAATLQPGDQVEIVTTRGEQLRLKIDSTDASGLQGDGKRVAYEDIQSISRRQSDSKRTMLVVLGVVAAGALAAAAGGGGGSSSY